MQEGKAKGSQLIIYPNGTLYHIDLKRSDNIPRNLFFVGAAERVDAIARQFDEVVFRHQNRARPEFNLAAGTYKGVPVAAFSCGIGVDNVEIALTEFHALWEYDHEADKWCKVPPRVNIIRVGTCGTSLPDVHVGAVAVSRYALGLDNLGAYYQTKNRDQLAVAIEKSFLATKLGRINPLSYIVPASPIVARTLERVSGLLGESGPSIVSGITTASPGFFAPEGRSIGRITAAMSFEEFRRTMIEFEYGGMKIVNHEMETSSLFRIGHEILEYNVGAICLVLDNLSSDEVLEKEEADRRMAQCISIALESMVALTKLR